MSLIDCITLAKDIIDDKVKDRLLTRQANLMKEGMSEKKAGQTAINEFANEYGNQLNTELNKLKKSIKLQTSEAIFKTKGNAEEINKSYDEQVKNISQPINTEQNAIRKQESNEMGIRQSSEVGTTMGSGDTQSESTASPQEKSKATSEEKVSIHAERPPTELSHRGLQETATEFGLSDVEKRQRKSDLQLRKEANDQIAEWKQKGTYSQEVNNLLEDAKMGKINDKERVILEQHQADLSQKARDARTEFGITSPEYQKAFEALEKFKNVGQSVRSEAGAVLRIPTFGSIPDESLEGYLLQEKELNKEAPLTDNQKELVSKEYEKINSTTKEYEEKLKVLQDENAKLKAQQEINKTKSSIKKATTNKTHEDFVKDRKSFLQEFKEAKASHEAWLKEQGIQKSGGGLTLTTDMAKAIGKIVKSYVEEGITKLEEIVSKVVEDLKEYAIPENEIRNVIAGEYAEKKKTRSEVTTSMRDLKTQQQLINKLEQLENGEVPKNEKAKIKRNQDIKELSDKVNKHGLTKLSEVKKRNETELAKVNEELKTGNFAENKKTTPLIQDAELKKNFPKAYNEALKSRDELIKAKHERALRLLKKMYENKTPQEKTLDVFSKSLNMPRTLMTIGDFSAVFRQAAVATTAHPIIASKALKFMFEAAANDKIYNRWLDDVHNDPLWSIAQQSKLPITDPESLHLKEKEEAFYGSQYAEQLPVVGGVVKASERAYNGYLNFIRWEMFKMYADKFIEDGKTYDNSKKLYDGLSSFIGSSTGRGGMKFGEAASPILNWFLFASRLIAARVNMLGLTDIPNVLAQGGRYAVKGVTLGKLDPHWGFDFGFYTRLPKEIRVKAAADMLKFVGVGMATLVLAKQMGAQVELDPRSTDFGKVHDKNTRWDIWGGFQPYARLLSQIVSGQSKSTTTGKVYELDGSKFGGKTIGDQIVTFGRGKLAPIWGDVGDVLTKRTLDQQTLDRKFDIPFYSKDNPPQGHITLTDELLKSITPLIVNDVREAVKDRGVNSIFTVGVPSLFGIGVQTYQPKQGKKKSDVQTLAH